KIPPREAYVRAAQEMARPVFAGTITILIVFMPLLFWPDIVGQFMRYMPITLLATLTASWLMAMIFLPALGAVWPMKKAPKPLDEDHGFYGALVNRYERVMHWGLKYPMRVVLGTLGVMVGIIGLYVAAGPGVEFFPRIEPERANVNLTVVGDLSLAEKDAIVREVEARMGMPEGVKTLITEVGKGTGRRNVGNEQTGQITMDYVEWEDGRPPSTEIIAEVQRRIGDVPGVEINVAEPKDGPQEGKPIEIQLVGNRFDDLVPLGGVLKSMLAEIPGTRNIGDDMPDPGIEWRLIVDREAVARIGSNLSEVGSMIRLGTNGAIVGTYRPDGSRDEIDIVVRLKEEQRSLDTLENLTVPIAGGGRVPLGDLTARMAENKVSTINRVDQDYAVTVDADLMPGVLAEDVTRTLQAKMAAYVETHTLPAGVRVVFKGEGEDTAKNAGFLEYAFILGLAVMGLVLLITFNSFYQVFVILSAVFFSTTGVLLGHLIFMKPFGIIMSGVGIIALAGTIVNNNIVLIDTYNSRRREMPWREAIIATGRERLRPVLLTAATTVVAILPMAFRINFDVATRSVTYNAPSSQWWDQLATAVAVGTTFATVLTLVVTPCMLALGEIAKERWAARRRAS
ncbi:MAG: MFS transporter, partial [Alphaproteobacteria bacterium CG_4_10_14_0_8_um_filter_53_9]